LEVNVRLFNLLALPIFVSLSHVASATDQILKPEFPAQKVITYKVEDLAGEISQTNAGRRFHSNRAIVEAEVLSLRAVLLEGQLPRNFSWHRGRRSSLITKVIGEVPESLHHDDNPKGRFFIFSVPDLHLEDLKHKPIPDYDMVLRYVDDDNREHYFVVSLEKNMYIGKVE
jgi:hypothetical protein